MKSIYASCADCSKNSRCEDAEMATPACSSFSKYDACEDCENFPFCNNAKMNPYDAAPEDCFRPKGGTEE